MECSFSTCTVPEFADLAEVVAPEVDEHIVLGKLLFVVQQALFKRLVLLVRFAARTGPREGKRCAARRL